MKCVVGRNFRCVVLSVLCLYVGILDAVVILVHGSFATNRGWWKSNGVFFEELSKQSKLLEPQQKVVSFAWSGTPSNNEIEKAGRELAEVIKQYPATEPIILIGHSHGGNVINKASQFLTQPQPSPLDVTPTTKQIVTEQQQVPGCPEQREYSIDKAFYLGTPVDMTRYAPNMNVIKYVINLYSMGDSIQRVLGFYNREYPLNDRLINLEVFFNKNNRKSKPNHYQLHDQVVGSWLLFIPDVLSGLKVNQFENFSYGRNSTITFDEQQAPSLGV